MYSERGSFENVYVGPNLVNNNARVPSNYKIVNQWSNGNLIRRGADKTACFLVRNEKLFYLMLCSGLMIPRGCR